MKSLIIHNVSIIDLKHLALIADIITGDVDEDTVSNCEIFEAATWFIQALKMDSYALDTSKEIAAAYEFIKVTEAFTNKLKKQLPPLDNA